MTARRQHSGFSLMEVVLAVGVLALGLLFVAGTFPAGVFLTAAATEQTIAPIAANEAFTKFILYGCDPNGTVLKYDQLKVDEQKSFIIDFNDIVDNSKRKWNDNERFYPSTDQLEKVYCWSMLVRKVSQPSDANATVPVQCTVFVCRRPGSAVQFPNPVSTGTAMDWPEPVKVTVGYASARKRELTVSTLAEQKYINDGSQIVVENTGNIYRVLSRDIDVVMLDQDWQETTGVNIVWVIPPPVGGGKSPCIGVFQRIIKISDAFKN